MSHEVPEDSNSIDVLPSINSNSKSPRTQIIHNIDEDKSKGSWQVSSNIFAFSFKYFPLQAVVRDGDFKLIWGQAKLLNKHATSKRSETRQSLKQSYKLFNIKNDPNEKHELDIEEYEDVVKNLKTILLEEYPKTTFPGYHHNIVKAYPGNNDGKLVTDWC